MYGDSLIRDIADGTISPPQALPQEVMEALKPFLKPNLERARALSALFGSSVSSMRKTSGLTCL